MTDPGAVPVEVPEEAVDAAARECASEHHVLPWDTLSTVVQQHYRDRASAMLSRAYPLIAARVQAEGKAERDAELRRWIEVGQRLTEEKRLAEAERDEYHRNWQAAEQALTRLGAAGGDREALGRAVREEWVAWAREQPDPKPSWLVSWEQLAEPDREADRRIGERLYGMGRADHDVRVRAEERQRALLEAADALYSDDGPGNLLSTATWLRERAARAAGSAVPVATPPTCEHGITGPHRVTRGVSGMGLSKFDVECPGPVATPEPLELVGIGEAATILGVSKQRVHQLCTTEAFPEPVARLAATPVWLRSAMVGYAAVRRDRRLRDPGPVATPTEPDDGPTHEQIDHYRVEDGLSPIYAAEQDGQR